MQIKESNTGFSSQKNSISFKFLNSFDQKGILDFLKEFINITCGETNQPISFIKNGFNSFFIDASSVNNAFIKFDFGHSKRIDLHSYIIGSFHPNGSLTFAPKSWIIEGSTDDINSDDINWFN